MSALTNQKRLFLAGVWGALLAGCASYPYAKNVKMVSFDGDLSAGHAVGPVRGESCQQMVMGYPIGEPATLDKAVADARQKNGLRYMSDVSTENTGFNAVVYEKRCLVAKGTGYQ
jgi:hypothetical protein